MSKKYMIHPQFVISKTDGDEHFISARDLMRLYRVSALESVVCKNCQRQKHGSCPYAWISPEYVHLFPRRDGNYELGEEEDE